MSFIFLCVRFSFQTLVIGEFIQNYSLNFRSNARGITSCNYFEEAAEGIVSCHHIALIVCKDENSTKIYSTKPHYFLHLI
jgi:hypothetical protein